MTTKISLKDKIFSALILVMIALCLKLGGWQVYRMHWKQNLIDKVELSKVTDPVPLQLENYDADRDLFKRVTAKGEFLNNHELYLGGKYLNEERDKAQIGVHVITPFRLDTGEVILVNRGWVPQEKRERMDRPESSVNGEVTLEGMIRESRGNPPWYMPANMPGKNVWFWLDVNAMEKYLERQGVKNTKPVLIQQTNMTVKDGRIPVLVSTDLQFYNEHLTYVYTWFSLAGVLFVMLIIWIIRTKKDAANKVEK